MKEVGWSMCSVEEAAGQSDVGRWMELKEDVLFPQEIIKMTVR
jgi:hypothetical protein